MIYGIGFLIALILLFLISPKRVQISYSDLTMPVRLSVSCDFISSGLGIDWLMEAGEKRLSVRVFRWHLKIYRREKPTTQVLPTKKEKVKKKKSKFTWAGFWRWVQVLKVPFPKLIRHLLRCSQNPRLHGEIEFGLSNPAETGKLLGVLLAFQNALILDYPVSLKFYPNFQESTWKSNFHFSFDFRLYQILMAIGRFLIHIGWRYYKIR